VDSLYGKKLTVVCFLQSVQPIGLAIEAVDALRSLTNEIAEPFGKKGVQVVGIDVVVPKAVVVRGVQEAGATFPCLLDAKGEYSAKLPETVKCRGSICSTPGKNLVVRRRVFPLNAEELGAGDSRGPWELR